MLKRSRDQMQATESYEEHFVDTEKRKKRKRISVEKSQEVFSETCSNSSHRSNSQERHSRTNIGDDIYGEDFLNKSDFNMQSRIYNSERPFPCHKCEKSFSCKRNLLKHTCIRRVEKAFACEKCPASFARRDNLNRHKQQVHTAKPIFSCDLCSAKFTIKSRLDRHRNRVHGIPRSFTHKNLFSKYTRAKTNTCRVCLQSFCDQRIYPTYTEKHAGRRPFSCIICLKNYSLNRDLIEHYRAHLGIQPFVCNICTKPFSRRSNLERHIGTHTTGNPIIKKESLSQGINFNPYSISNEPEDYRARLRIKRFDCVFCTRPFTKRSNLERHMRTHTSEDLSIKDESFNTCCVSNGVELSKCKSAPSAKHSVALTDQKVASQENGNYKRISSSLTDEQSFVCKICFKTFLGRSALAVHTFFKHPADRQTSESQATDSVPSSSESQATDSVSSSSQSIDNSTSFMCSKCHESITRMATICNTPPKQTTEKSIHSKRPHSSSKTLNLRKHNRVDTDESSDDNEGCSKMFTAMSCKQTRMNERQSTSSGVSHARKKEHPPFRCKFCFKSFINKAGLSSHNLNKHKQNFQGASSTTMSTSLKSEKTDFIKPPRAKESRGQPSNAVSVGSISNDETTGTLIPIDSIKQEKTVLQPSSADNYSCGMGDVSVISNSRSFNSPVVKLEDTGVGVYSESVCENPSFQQHLKFHSDEVTYYSALNSSTRETGRSGKNEIVELFTCNTCLMSFTDSRSLADHLSMHAQSTPALDEPVGLI